MFDVWMLIALLGIVGLVFGGKKVAELLTLRENSSGWFQENVGTEYVLDFPDKERESFEQLQEKIRSKHDPDKENDDWIKMLRDRSERNAYGSEECVGEKYFKFSATAKRSARLL